MITETQPLSQITKQSIELLSKEMGMAITIHFFSQFSTGHGNYTEERNAMFKYLTLDEILNRMKNL
jgi:hypothetical protein